MHPLYHQYFENIKRPTPGRLWQRPISKYDDEKEWYIWWYKVYKQKNVVSSKNFGPKNFASFFCSIIVYIKPFKAKYWQKNLFFPGQFCAISRHVTSHHTCAIFQTNYVQISSFFKKGQNRVVVERSLKFGTTETGEGGDVRATVGGG